jgi:hypothetical protein
MAHPRISLPDQAVSDYLAGTLKGTAASYGVHAKSLRRWLVDRGVQIRLPNHHKAAPDRVRDHGHRSPQDRTRLTPSEVRSVEYREPAPVCEMPKGAP